MSQKERGLCS